MEDKTKKTIFLIGSLFVAVIFVTSYAAFNNNGSAPASSSTTVPAGTPLSGQFNGAANALVENYTDLAYVSVTNRSQMSKLNDTLGALQANGTITFDPIPGNSTTYSALLSSITTYQLYLYLSNSLSGGNVLVSGVAYVKLPNSVYMYQAGSSALVTIPNTTHKMMVKPVVAINSTIPVKMRAILTTTHQVYGTPPNLTLTEG